MKILVIGAYGKVGRLVTAEALEILRTYSNIAWTYVTPAFDFGADGPATGA